MTSTGWKQVPLILAAGVIAAAQIGKAAIAAPLMASEFGLDLIALSWIVGAYAVLGAVGGIVAGFVASHFAMTRVIVAGLLLVAAGSLLGAGVAGFAALLATRVLEGCGFLAIVVSAPALLRGIVPGPNQPVVFACWSAYIPTGAALTMLLGPSIMADDWRVLWIVNGALAALVAGLLALALRDTADSHRAPQRPGRADVLALLRSTDKLLLAFAFLIYAVQYYALATFLPVFLVDSLGLSLAQAGMMSALALGANAVGNICAGMVLRLGVPLWRIVTLVFATLGITGFGIFSASAPPVLVAVSAGLSLGVSALLPASVLATAPRISQGSAALALTIGLIQQASALGQCFGPVILAFWVGHFEWGGVSWLFVLVAVLGLATAAAIRRRGPLGTVG